MFVSKKSRSVIDFLTLRHRANRRPPRPGKEVFEIADRTGLAAVSAVHVVLEAMPDPTRKAHACLRGFNPRPLGDRFLQRDRDVLHPTKIAFSCSCVKNQWRRC